VKLRTVLVTSIDREGVIEYDGVNIQFVPASAYAYTVGRNTLQKKLMK